MRVIHVITRLVVGGAQENTVATVLGLRQRPGVEIRLISGPTTGPEGSLESNFKDFPGLLEIEPALVRPVNPILDSLALVRLTHAFKKQRPDIVHTHSGKAGVLGRLAAARAGVPVIVHTIHGPSFGPFQGALSNLIFRRCEHRAARVTTHFVSVAEAMTRHYLAAGLGTPRQYTTIFSGFNLKPFLNAENDPSLRRGLNIGPNDTVVGMIARLFKLKGHDDLIEAAPSMLQRCPKLKFLLIGDGQWRERLQQKAAALGVEKNFVFIGLVKPEEIPVYVGIMDLLVHLSRREGLPRALPQALAAVRPVVAYDCDGASEVCRDGETGFLISPGDKRLLTERVVQLAADAGLRERLGKRGQDLVRDTFSVDTMVERIYTLYLQLMERRQN